MARKRGLESHTRKEYCDSLIFHASVLFVLWLLWHFIGWKWLGYLFFIDVGYQTAVASNILGYFCIDKPLRRKHESISNALGCLFTPLGIALGILVTWLCISYWL